MSKIHDTTRAATLVNALRERSQKDDGSILLDAADLIEELTKPTVDPLHQIEVLKLQLQGAQEQRDEALKTVEKLTKERNKAAVRLDNELKEKRFGEDYSAGTVEFIRHPRTESEEVKFLNNVINSQAKTIHELGQS